MTASAGDARNCAHAEMTGSAKSGEMGGDRPAYCERSSHIRPRWPLSGASSSLQSGLFPADQRTVLEERSDGSPYPTHAGGVPMTEWYFVWVEGLRGPMPQKWSSDGLWGQVGRQDVIVRFTLSDEEKHLPLDELARRHPIPGAK